MYYFSRRERFSLLFFVLFPSCLRSINGEKTENGRRTDREPPPHVYPYTTFWIVL